MDQKQLLNQIVSYGIQNKKKKDEILSAILKTGKFDITTAASSLKQIGDLGAFDYEATNNAQDSIDSKAKERLGTGPLLQQYYTNRNILEKVKQYKDLYLEATQDNALLPTEIMGENAAKLKSMYNDILFQTAQAEGTGALQAADRAIVEDMLPNVSSANPLSIAGQAMRGGRKGNVAAFDTILESAKSRVERLSGEKYLDPSEQKTQPVPGFQQAMDFARQNPNDPNSQKLIAALRNGEIDPITGQKKSVEAVNQPAGQPTPEQPKGDWIATAGKVGNALGSFFGGNKIGEAIGDVIGGQMAKFGEAGETFTKTIASIEKLYQEGKINEAKRNAMLDAQEKAAKDAFGYSGPSFKQVAGDVIKSAATVLGGVELKGATLLGTAVRTAGVGVAIGTGNAMAKDKNLKDTVIEAALSGMLAGAFPIVGKGLGKLGKLVIGKNTPEEALGEILQGKMKDLKPGQKALSVIDTKGAKTYQDLSDRLLDDIKRNAKHVDSLLSKDTAIIKLDDLAVEAATEGGKKIRTNFVERALTHMEEMYSKIGDDVKAANLKELLAKAKDTGLTRNEVNQLSREYNMAFGQKAFGKMGEPLTSVNAQLYEGTRSGLKEVARSGINGKEAQELDQLISDQIHTKDLIDKNIEAVNRLEQKAEKMGIGRATVKRLLDATNLLTGGALRGVKDYFTQSNVGRKTMNYLDIEGKLDSNLNILRKAEKSQTVGALEKAIRQFNRDVLNKVKGMKAGMSIEVSPQVRELNATIQRLTKSLENAKKRGASEGTIKNINKAIDEAARRRNSL